jgi:uncharacterized membrane protein
MLVASTIHGIRTLFILSISGWAGFSCGALAQPPMKSVDFARDVRPILSNRCFKCHGPDDSTRKGGLRLDLREAALDRGKSGEITIVPGHPGDSELIRRLHAQDPDERMPPASAKMELSEKEKEILTQWINQGALGLRGSQKSPSRVHRRIHPPETRP